MNKFLIAITLTFAPSLAVAEWTMIQTNDNGNMYIDFDTIKKSGDLVTTSTLNDYYGMQQKNELSSQWVELYDCKNKKFKALSMSYFAENMGKGNIIETFSLKESDVTWSDIVPYSIGELKTNIICSK